MALSLGVLVSGNGTNLQAILDAAAAHTLHADVRLVISNQADAFALTRAARANVPHVCISHRAYDSREAFDEALVRALTEAEVEWVVLAGFMRVLTPYFISAFQNRIVNIHPSLLPAFPGTHALREALEYGVKISGCTVHLVDLGVDTGPILAQRAVPVRDDDDEARLAERVHRAEHELLLEVLQAIAEGRLELETSADSRPRVRLRPR